MSAMAQTRRRTDPLGLIGTVLDGRFHIEHEVAEGGFGIVYHARQVTLDRPVALKILKIPPDLDDTSRAEFCARFAAEAKTIARIRHPNIVDVYDFGVSTMPSGGEAPWIALEWLRGRTLEDHLNERRGLGGQPPASVLAMLRPILRAFAHAHREGIVHRDIKPANIMIVSNDAGSPTELNGVLRILDFGIAKVMAGDESSDSGHTRTANFRAFSPMYAAPEQIGFGRTGPWTDVHALGLIATEMLLDASPYRGIEMQLFEEVMASTRPTPATRGVDVGPWEQVLGKAVALSPSQRWKNVGEFLTALEASVNQANAAAIASAVPKTGNNSDDSRAEAVESSAKKDAGAGNTLLYPDHKSAETLPLAGDPDTVVMPERTNRRRRVALATICGSAVCAIGLWLVLAAAGSKKQDRSTSGTSALPSSTAPKITSSTATPPLAAPAKPVQTPRPTEGTEKHSGARTPEIVPLQPEVAAKRPASGSTAPTRDRGPETVHIELPKPAGRRSKATQKIDIE